MLSLGTGDRETAGAGFAEAETEGAAAFFDLTFAAGITVDLSGEELASEEGVDSDEVAAIAG
ncbi:MAG TPA: hypothetical protein VFH31_10810 [Pyrinomonadaceae bacterium]|nr:hypothetical protein [Pyrinomonadaceae bacterium]